MGDSDNQFTGTNPMGTATDAMREAGDRMRAAGNVMADHGSQFSLRILSQAEANTQEAFRAMRAAAQARDVNDVLRIQADYLREQGARSMAQAREVSELIADFGRAAVGQQTDKA